MAGGQGTRFWPVSTPKKPKQYINLFSDKSLLQDTLDRLEGIADQKGLYIVTVKNQFELAEFQSKNFIPSSQIILEPEGRNTAPCIYYGLIKLLADGHDPNAVVAVLPSDHVILNRKKFQETLKDAAELALQHQKIVTIGINPTMPHTGYGYIELGEQLGMGFGVNSFKEKPDLETAKKYLASEKFLWNAGMFIAPIKLLLQEFSINAPEFDELKDELLNSLTNENSLREVYQKFPKDSIDYKIMEKSDSVACVTAKFDWNDLGSWDALEDVMELENDNFLAAKKSFKQIDAKENIIFAPEMNVSLIGVSDLVVVAINDQLMILPKKLAQRVKELTV